VVKRWRFPGGTALSISVGESARLSNPLRTAGGYD
jgi:hypothetical protein